NIRGAAPGGRVGVTLPNYARPAAQQALLRRLRPEVFRTHNLAMMRPEALQDLFLEAGLTDLEVGMGSGAQFLTAGTPKDLLGHLFLTAARAWNAACVFFPAANRLWGCRIFAIGRRP